VRDLVERFRGLGGVVRTADPVTAVLSSKDEVTGVRLQSGAVLDGDEVVVCCGRWTDQVLGLAGLQTQFVARHSAGGTPVPGLLVVTDSRDNSIARVVAVDDINYRPERNRRTMVWSGIVDGELQRLGGAEADPDVVDKLAVDLLARAAYDVPALAGASVHRAMVTQRAMPADGLPVVGRPPGIDGLYIVLAHAAATLAPVFGELVAAEVAHQRIDARLDRFRPGRLMSSNASSSDA
jgi:glycine/D-amino acid oxidase-like deaminating enzyme